MADLLADLAAEHADLDALVAGLPDDAWDIPTPAAGWSVRDSISHLAFFDEQALRSATEPDGFRAELVEVLEDPAAFIDAGPLRGRQLAPGEVLRWWREARTGTLRAFAVLAPGTRLPWYGPDMSPASFATARLMETWAHGQDVADALAVRRQPTARLRHVAHIGVRTLGFSFVSAGLEPPREPVRVELRTPDGGIWAWGPAEAADRVTGSALGFCLLVTQRRHQADTDVTAAGPVATAWLTVAQAFAGPAGAGRAPGMPAA